MPHTPKQIWDDAEQVTAVTPEDLATALAVLPAGDRAGMLLSAASLFQRFFAAIDAVLLSELTDEQRIKLELNLVQPLNRIRDVANTPPQGTFTGLCSCIGPIGTDAYCPCVMKQRGLTPTEVWAPAKKAEFAAALEDCLYKT